MRALDRTPPLRLAAVVSLILAFPSTPATGEEKEDEKPEPRVVEFDPEATPESLRSRDGTRWDPRGGGALEGPLKGRRLSMLPAIVSFARAWSDFHPDSAAWSPGAEASPKQ